MVLLHMWLNEMPDLRTISITQKKQFYFHFECWMDGQWHEMYVGTITPDDPQASFTKQQLRDTLTQKFNEMIQQDGVFNYDGTVILVNTFQAYRVRVSEEIKGDSE